MTTQTTENTTQVAGAPESYSSDDLALVTQASTEPIGSGQTAPGTVVEPPPSTTDAPPPGASPPDPRVEEAEKALAEERTKFEELQRTNEEFQRKDEEARFQADVTTEVQKRQDQLIQQNWGETEARQEAQSYGRAVIAERTVSSLNTQLEDAGRLVRAMQLEKETGVAAADLLNYRTPAEMERGARSRSTESKRIATLEAEIVEMKKGAVPAGQHYDGNQGTGGTSDEQLIAAAARGDVVDMSAVQKALDRLP